MMHERSYIHPFNLNGSDYMQRLEICFFLGIVEEVQT
jgi:hypothetical protein